MSQINKSDLRRIYYVCLWGVEKLFGLLMMEKKMGVLSTRRHDKVEDRSK